MESQNKKQIVKVSMEEKDVGCFSLPEAAQAGVVMRRDFHGSLSFLALTFQK